MTPLPNKYVAKVDKTLYSSPNANHKNVLFKLNYFFHAPIMAHGHTNSLLHYPPSLPVSPTVAPHSQMRHNKIRMWVAETLIGIRGVVKPSMNTA